jgi:hypothetical protein
VRDAFKPSEDSVAAQLVAHTTLDTTDHTPMRRPVWRIGIVLALFAGCLWLQGCGTSGAGGDLKPHTFDVTLAEKGRLTVRGRQTDLQGLPGALRALGATSKDVVRVTVPATTAANERTAIGRKLASAGFRKIVFTGPVRSEAYVSSNSVVRPPPPRVVAPPPSRTAPLKPMR